MKNEKDKLRNQSHSPIATKRIKCLGIYLPKETKELYTENYKTLMKEKKKHKWMETYSMFLGRKNQYCENDYTTKRNLQIQCNTYQITNGIFHRTRTKSFTIHIETKKTPNSQVSQFSRSVMPDFLRPHESQHARPPCPSPTPGVHSDSCPSSQ